MLSAGDTNTVSPEKQKQSQPMPSNAQRNGTTAGEGGQTFGNVVVLVGEGLDDLPHDEEKGRVHSQSLLHAAVQLVHLVESLHRQLVAELLPDFLCSVRGRVARRVSNVHVIAL